MGRKRLDLTGRRFGDLEALECSGVSQKGSALWRCLCHRCGAECIVEGYRLTDTRRPKTDCGCKLRERRADLSGQTFGGLDVIRRCGIYEKGGDYLYLCRCRHCGKEVEEPASTLRAAKPPESCGCIRYPAARMKALSEKGLDVTLDREKGTNLYTVTKTTPDADNMTTGYRWVRKRVKKGREYWHAVFWVCGKRYYKGGFDSPESASEWAQKEHALVLAENGIKNPRKRRKIDLTGQRFGRLVVIGENPERHRSPSGWVSRQWDCQCDCGRIVTVLQNNLRGKNPPQSCGCGWGAGPRTKPKDRVTFEQARAEIAANAADKTPGWKLKGPDGEIVYTDNLSRFCRERNFRKPLQSAQRLSNSWIYLNGGDVGKAHNVTVEGWRVIGRNPPAPQERPRNPTAYTGINWHKGRNKWQLTYYGKYVGLYTTHEEAVDALRKLKADSE